MRMAGQDPHTLAGAYAMDAVDDGDRVRFERHLAGCGPCRQEIRGLRAATARLAAATQLEPPAQLRAAALLAARQTRQLPPAPAAGAARLAVRGLAVRGLARRGGLAGLARRGGLAGLARRAGLAGWVGWRPWLAASLAGVLAAAAVLAAVVAYGTSGRLSQAQHRDRAVAAVLSAPDATMLTARVLTGGTATVVMSHRMGELVFTAADLRKLPAGRGYELWLMGSGGPRAAGMLHAAGSPGMAGPMLVTGLAARDMVGVTIEPAGGSARPTTRPVVLLRLA